MSITSANLKSLIIKLQNKELEMLQETHLELVNPASNSNKFYTLYFVYDPEIKHFAVIAAYGSLLKKSSPKFTVKAAIGSSGIARNNFNVTVKSKENKGYEKIYEKSAPNKSFDNAEEHSQLSTSNDLQKTGIRNLVLFSDAAS